MSNTILLADDSKTIQKVIRITLSQEPFEVEVCESEEALIQKAASGKYSLVLLDFGLSESLSGYDLAKEIRKIASSLPIIMLFGTFDSVDDNLLNDAGVNDKIIKPFDSQHFIKLVASVAEEGGANPSVSQASSVSLPDPTPVISEEEDVDEDAISPDVFSEMPKPSASTNASPGPLVLDEIEEEDDNWSVDLPSAPKIKMPDAPKVANLKEIADDWSVEVPPVIGSKEIEDDHLSTGDIPPVIAEEDEKEITESFEIPEELNEVTEPDPIPVEAPVMPSNQDLDYPDIDDGIVPTVDDIVPQLKSPEPPIPSLNEAEISDFTEPTMALKDFNEKKVENIESRIEETSEEEDFWAIDEDLGEGQEELVQEEIVDVEEEPAKDLPGKLPGEVEVPSGPLAFSAPADTHVSVDELVDKLKPFIEEKIKEHLEAFMRESIEKVSWEVIPDLAENLIKKDLEEIKSQSLNN